MKILNWILLIVLSCIWGSSFILMKLGMYTSEGEVLFTDGQVASMRMLIAALVLLPFAFSSFKKLVNTRNLLLLSVVGVFGNFIPAFMFTYAETEISSGYAGMLNSFTPIFALTIGFIVFRNRLTTMQIIGVIIGTIGIVLLTLSGQDFSADGSWMHVGAVILATLCYAISLNTIKHTLQGLKSFEITALSFFIIVIPSAIISLMNGSFNTLSSNPEAMNGLFYIVLLSVIGTAFAVILFNKLISNSSVLFASSVTYLIPIVAILIGFGFGEEVNLFQVISMFVVFMGIFVANVLPSLVKTKRQVTNKVD